MNLEVVVVPVSDVDRAKAFYVALGWREDADFATGPDFRVVQLTPPGSACSVIFGTGITSATPGAADGLQLVVNDIEAARSELGSRGAQVSEVFHDSGGVFHHAGDAARVPGPAPDHSSYGSFASFSDPDGNGWILQEVTTRLPGRVARPSASYVPRQREPRLAGQTVVVIGGSAGIGLETARLARAEGADVILTGRNADRLHSAATDVGALSTATFDANDLGALEAFFGQLTSPIDHVMVTAGGPYYAPLAEMDFDEVRGALQEHPMVMLGVARYAAGKVRPGGTLVFMGGTAARHPAVGVGITSALTMALPALTASLALEVAPVRVNLIAAGFVDTPLSGSLLGDQLEARRAQLRTTLPIGRVVEPSDVAMLAVHIMTNTALTGATYDIDGGQQHVLR